MARRSKRNVPNDIKPPNIYNVAVYIRLSVEDRLYKKGSDSLNNQKELIYDYIKDKAEMNVYDVYCDNGETGTDFEREDFQRMMYDIYNGDINCIIVKDLSRFGREYIEAGDYLDRIFPLIGVRFIAINDHYDNKVNPFDITVPIKNIINTLYARDLSKKSSAAIRIKQTNGKFIGSYAAYGYIKSPEDKNKIIVDKKAADVVKQIFEWKADGIGNAAICNKLCDMSIMPPSRYRYDKGIIKDERFKNSILWNIDTIKNMLQNEVYIGNLVQGRRKSQFYDGKKEIYVDKSEWIISENTHEAIISKELFNKVQAIIDERHMAYNENLGKYNKISNNNNIFKHKLVCGDCGTKLTRYKNVIQLSKKIKYTHICPCHSKYPKHCNFISIDENLLKDIVMKSVDLQISYLTNVEEMLSKALNGTNIRKKKMTITKEISDTLSNISYIKKRRIRTTVDYGNNVLDDDSYKLVMTQFDTDLKAETEKLIIINKQKDKLEGLLSSSKWISELKKFKGNKKLSKEIIDIFIEKIVVYSDKRIEITWLHNDKCSELLSHSKDGDLLAR